MKKLFVAVIGLLVGPCLAATIFGILGDSTGTPQSPVVVFTPTSTPQYINGVYILDVTKKAEPCNGLFAINLLGGNYDVTFPGYSKEMCITVPYVDPSVYTLQYVNSLCQGSNSGAPRILTFTNSATTSEVGVSITNLTLGWTLSGLITSLTLDNGIGAVSPSSTTYSYTDAFSTNKTFLLTASDGMTNVFATTTVTFSSRRYWGSSTNLPPTNDDLLAGSSDLASNRLMTRTMTPSNQHMYFAFPTNFGTPTFIFTPLGSPDAQFFPPTTLFVTNTAGSASVYNIYTGTNLNTGTFPYQVQ